VTILKSKANDEWKEDLEKSFGYVNLIYKKKKKKEFKFKWDKRED